MDMINAIIDSLIRCTLLGVSLVACGYGLWSIGSFFLKLAGKLIRLWSDPAARHQGHAAVVLKPPPSYT